MNTTNSNQKKFTTRKIVLIGLFAALSYVSLYFKIPIPSPVGKPFLHMGNMFVLLASLLFDGLIGGLAGSIGMGLFDVMNGYAASSPKTFILKFGIGMITGNVASKKDKESAKSPLKWIAVSSVIFTAVGIWLLILSIKRGNQIAIPGIEKELVINPVLYIFSLILGISKRLSIKMQYVIIGAVAGIAFNIVGEFAFGVLTLMLAGSRFYPAVLASAVSLPATLINGVFSIFAAVALYIPLSKAVSEFEF
jgi:uncharacterized membrane protein